MKKNEPKPIANITPFGLRMQPKLKASIDQSAKNNNRSMNAEIVARLESVANPYIRLYKLKADGSVKDSYDDYGIESFAGVIPSVGDEIIESGVQEHLDRFDPTNRVIWKVVRRVFNARDMMSGVALVVQERAVDPELEYEFIAP